MKPSFHQNFENLPERICGLGLLAENLWWSWHPAARLVFKSLSRQAWKDSVHNPDKMLKELPRQVLEDASRDVDFLRHYDLVMSQFQHYLDLAAQGCSLLHTDCLSCDPTIVYFSAEYGLHHSLPLYAGGLGFLAGDFIKECSDLNVPLVAVGFMYPEGYVRQRIGDTGWQESMSERLDRDAAPISRVLDETGAQMVVQVPVIEPPIYVTVWRVMVGRVTLYLLDTDTDLNDPWNRNISAQLYSGDRELRLRQEIVLGIGGSEVLEKMGVRATVLHLNEGHAAFALLERIRDLVQAGMTFEDAREHVTATSVFTTHTPVPAGHDVFPYPLMERYFRSYWSSLGLDRDRFLQLGLYPEDSQAGFNMTALALRLSGFRNAVSKRHGEVSRRIWKSLWPGTPEDEVPIDHVTNGVHVPTWIEPKLKLLCNRHFKTEWLDDHDNAFLWALIDEIPDNVLWRTHMWLKIKLLNVIRDRSRQRWAMDGQSPTMVITGGAMLDPNVLTIGFARRFATYKRADLIFHDLARLKNILTNRWQPVQIIFAGKAHPADDPGKVILQKIIRHAQGPALGGRIAFVEDYGEQFAQYLVHGVDLWLNNPLPPMEACGTSGMKAALNGVPSLSILDGWWHEAFTGDNGWAFAHAAESDDPTAGDSRAIYELLEKIVPIYYNMHDHDYPVEWVWIMKNAIKSCAARFSARRMVKEYIEKFYVKALAAAAGPTPDE